MLNYYNPTLTEWITSGYFWTGLISAHFLMILVPGFVAMWTEEPHVFQSWKSFPKTRDQDAPLSPDMPADEHWQKAA